MSWREELADQLGHALHDLFGPDARYNRLIDLISNSGLVLNKLLKGDVDYIIENRADINKAYKNVVKKSGSSNESSLIVYSGPVSGRHYFIRKSNQTFNLPYVCRRYRYEYYEFPNLEEMVACLYLGDTDLNQASGGYGIIKAIYQNLGEVRHNIGTIQVPHHGSEKNFNDDILPYRYPKLYFASFGLQNPYGHPSYKVVADIEMHSHFISVTEDRNSALVEVIYRR